MKGTSIGGVSLKENFTNLRGFRFKKNVLETSITKQKYEAKDPQKRHKMDIFIKNTWNASIKRAWLVVQGYQRMAFRELRKVVAFLTLLALISLLYKFFFVYGARSGLLMERACLEFINTSVDRCLQYETRSDQNKAFAAIKTHLPLRPLKMTRSNSVFLYTYKEPYVVIKRCVLPASSDLAEDNISMLLDNEYIVRFYKSFREKRVNDRGEEETIVWVFMEYLEVGVDQDFVSMDEEKIREIISSVLHGLRYLHGLGFAHLDLKISNVMGRRTENGVVYKIIDFGYARKFFPEADNFEMFIESKSYGTYPYKAVEVSQFNVHGSRADIWCVGGIVWFLSLGRTPFYLGRGKKDLDKYREFVHGRLPIFFNKNASLALKNFVRKCMSLDRFSRPTAAELLEHPFITKSHIEDIKDDIGVTEDYSSGYESDTGDHY